MIPFTTVASIKLNIGISILILSIVPKTSVEPSTIFIMIPLFSTPINLAFTTLTSSGNCCKKKYIIFITCMFQQKYKMIVCTIEISSHYYGCRSSTIHSLTFSCKFLLYVLACDTHIVHLYVLSSFCSQPIETYIIE